MEFIENVSAEMLREHFLIAPNNGVIIGASVKYKRYGKVSVEENVAIFYACHELIVDRLLEDGYHSCVVFDLSEIGKNLEIQVPVGTPIYQLKRS